ncbi:hypothetical protein CJ030_MR3G005770 [Morella rubra]|uniref:Uncharacterized protein n=1 Tax=Morella rubra TaxID=262757 RepID=A0A6A1W3H3_9ROSI|nr:hypothetical protein CJ030_MR3G005770 [Morella rubra]
MATLTSSTSTTNSSSNDLGRCLGRSPPSMTLAPRHYSPSTRRRPSPASVKSPFPRDVVDIPPSPPVSTTHPRGNSPPATTSRARRRVKEPSSSSSPAPAVPSSRPRKLRRTRDVADPAPNTARRASMQRRRPGMVWSFMAQIASVESVDTVWDEEDTDGSGGSSGEECYEWENFMGHYANSSSDDHYNI